MAQRVAAKGMRLTNADKLRVLSHREQQLALNQQKKSEEPV